MSTLDLTDIKQGIPDWNYYRYEPTIREDTGEVRFWLHTFPVKRETAAGVFIDKWGQEIFILDNVEDGWKGKRFAYPTKEAAWFSLCKRVSWRERHLERQLTKALRINQSAKMMYAPPNGEGFTLS